VITGERERDNFIRGNKSYVPHGNFADIKDREAFYMIETRVIPADI